MGDLGSTVASSGCRCLTSGCSRRHRRYPPGENQGPWLAAATGLAGYDPAAGRFGFLPAGVDWVLLAALVAYSGCGGITNVTLSNWARDRGYGMGERAGYIPAAVGGARVHLAHSGFMLPIDAANLRRYRGW
jgi:hypothetical protein